jgi:uncharacterized membrane protein YeiH
MIGRTPAGWMQDLEYVYVIAFAFVLSFYFVENLINFVPHFFIRYDWFRCFTLIGLEKGINIGLHPVICMH